MAVAVDDDAMGIYISISESSRPAEVSKGGSSAESVVIFLIWNALRRVVDVILDVNEKDSDGAKNDPEYTFGCVRTTTTQRADQRQEQSCW
jgi:hypothetical protein